ncbi:betaine-aldehyde dehydrogenase [Microbispora rosea]|uniref:aldehyde dehydrogenase (NAD(+)) n=1 Tax=Microbispora rosea TaxID=58117 RepID=A0A1N7ELU8_9ACTN|nr:aldehyde dehydrogenase family protein [Microbispora rosea]GIH50040.1 aldehyde dehydrogenase [Microbispora rosea subsp. rosea]SIR88875.1 betaine-aldehyde dehydrogenase [Microbispora rosea]
MASPRGTVDDSLWLDNARVVPSGSTYVPVDDSATGEEIARVRSATSEDVDRAFDSAARAQRRWAGVSPADRVAVVGKAADILEGMADDLAVTMQAEVGTVASQVRGAQVGLGLAAMRLTAASAFATITERERIGGSEVVREPAGVVGAITPWNYPLFQVALKVAPAIAAGCGVVLKPAEVAPLTTFLVAEAFAEAGLPAGVLNVVCGSGASVGSAIAGHPRADFVSFTGSVAAGREVAMAAARWGTRTSLELGGKSAAIVLDEDKVRAAVRHTIASCFGNAGQTCAALSRLIVPRHLLEEAEDEVRAVLEQVVVGDPFDAASTVGPLASREQRNRVAEHLRVAGETAGVRTVAAKDVSHLTRGWYAAPTVVVADDPGAPIVQEEVFGPVLAIQPADDEAHAVELAEGTRFGLIARVWTDDDARFERVARRLRVGGVIQSDAPTAWDAPFGGVKDSGYGRERGAYGVEEYLVPKSLQRGG